MSTPTIPTIPTIPVYPGELPPQPPVPRPPRKPRKLLAAAGVLALVIGAGTAGALASGHSGPASPAASASPSPVISQPIPPGVAAPAPDASALIQSDGYNATFQSVDMSASPVAQYILSAADGLDSAGNGEVVEVLNAAGVADGTAIEQGAVSAQQAGGYPDATGTLDGDVIRVDIPASDGPSL